MSNVQLNVQKSPSGTVALFEKGQEVTSVEISQNVKMEIDIGTGFTSGATVSGFSLFNNVNGAKGRSIGNWSRATPNDQPSPEISIAVDGATGIQVTDTDTTTEDELFYFSIQVADGNEVYDTDPELKVKKIRG